MSACSFQSVQSSEALSGTVFFQARQPTPLGASKGTVLLPAQYAQIHALNESGQIVGTSFVDAAGHFRVTTRERATSFEVMTRASIGKGTYTVTSDARGLLPHRAKWRRDAEQTDIIFLDNAKSRDMAGALHVLYTIAGGAAQVSQWAGRSLPSLFVHWQPGETAQWSYYWGERPRGSGRHKVELLAAHNDQRKVDDTDEHDEAIVLHEFSHFVFREWSTDSSTGGYHPVGFLVEPGLAWEEGRASWLSATIRRSAKYQDAIGLEPYGGLRLEYDFERGKDSIPSPGSEPAVASLLWDLSDGAEGIVDNDYDGIALGPTAILNAMVELREIDGAYPSLSAFLQFLIAKKKVTRSALKALLVDKGYSTDLLRETWPQRIRHGEVVRHRIDGVSNPAPSGGPAYPESGLDAVHIYQTYVPESGWIKAELVVDGSGKPSDLTNLDLELRELGSDAIISSATHRQREVVEVPVSRGYHLLYVRDGGEGNRANYALNLKFSSSRQ